MNHSNRRQFLKLTAAALGGLLLLSPTASLAQSKKPAPMLDPKDPTAKAVKYVEDSKKAPAAKGNNCSNCAFYTKKEVRAGKEAGECIIFPGKYVYGSAFCNSWAKKS